MLRSYKPIRPTPIPAFLAMIAILGVSAWPTAPGRAAPPATAVVTAGGVALRSVSADLPFGEAEFPGGADAQATNNNCLVCHSAEMVLDQPRLSRAAWQSEVDKMRSVYKAPVTASDVPAIVDYLTSLPAPPAGSPLGKPTTRGSN
jgi:hypothetical protein